MERQGSYIARVEGEGEVREGEEGGKIEVGDRKGVERRGGYVHTCR